MTILAPASQRDVYKEFHRPAYHPEVTEVYSNFTNRFGKYAPDNHLGGVINVGAQYFIKDYLINEWDEGFFNKTKHSAVLYHQRIVSAMLGYQIDIKYLEDLHDLGYLPLEIKTLPEGTIVPYGVPSITVKNTHPDFFWLTNCIETVMSAEIWQMQTSATTAANYKLNFMKAGRATGIPEEFWGWQGHDFSFRGMPGRFAAAASGFGHLTSFYGTDTIPAVIFAEEYYNANVDTELVGGSVNATEHSVTCSWEKEGELAFLDYLMDEVAPEGVLSIVADTWDFWNLVTVLLPQRKDKILARNGKIVIRPDSGDPVDILCGVEIRDFTDKGDLEVAKAYALEALVQEELNVTPHGEPGDNCPEMLFKHGGKVYNLSAEIEWDRYDKRFYYYAGSSLHSCEEVEYTPEMKGLVECLWDIFEGEEINGFKHLNAHIGAIYGDSITLSRQHTISKCLIDKGFAPNIVLGIGSYTYQHVTRDTHGSAVKATSVIKAGKREAISKDPKTDPSKRSARGLLQVVRKDDKLVCNHDVSPKDEAENNLLEIVYCNGKLVKETSLENIRKTISDQLESLLA